MFLINNKIEKSQSNLLTHIKNREKQKYNQNFQTRK